MDNSDPCHYVCPKEKTHKFDTKERLIKHLSNCKLLKGFPSFLSCRYETYHLFASQADKERHEMDCRFAQKNKDRPILTNYSFQNPGYDAEFVPKRIDTGFYNQNKERLAREDEEIKIEKAKVRVNLADITSREEPLSIYEDGKIVFFAQLEGGFVRMGIRPFNRDQFASINSDFQRNTIYSLVGGAEEAFMEKVANGKATKDCIGEFYVQSNSPAFTNQINAFKSEIVNEGKMFTIKDKKENIFIVMSIRKLNADELLKLDSTLTYTSIVVVFHLKSDFFNQVTIRSKAEKDLQDTIQQQHNEIEAIKSHVKSLEDNKMRHERKVASLMTNNDSLKADLANLNQRIMKESEASGEMVLLKLQQEVNNLKNQIQERHTSWAHESKIIKEQKLEEYMRILIEDLTKVNDKMLHHKNNIVTYTDNISQIETYNVDLQKTIDSLRIKGSETQEQIELAKEILSKEKDVTGVSVNKNKKGVVVHPKLLCHLCKETYVSMVTKPCNHCILCWNCYHGFVQSGLKNCLACNKRIEFVFKIKFM